MKQLRMGSRIVGVDAFSYEPRQYTGLLVALENEVTSSNLCFATNFSPLVLPPQLPTIRSYNFAPCSVASNEYMFLTSLM